MRTKISDIKASFKGVQSEAVLCLLLMASILVVYWPFIRYPFVCDDWIYLGSYVRKGFLASFKRYVLTYYSATSYCPLPSLWALSLYNLFGLNPVIFRLFTFSMVFMNGYLIVRILRLMFNDNVLAWGAAFLFVTTAKIHLFTLVSFIAGFCDVGSLFFFLLSFLLFIKQRHGLSSLAFLLALFSKASAVILPLVLFLYAAILPEQNKKPSFLGILYRLRFHILLLLIISIPIRYAPGWRVDMWGPHIIENIKYYSLRSFHFLFPVPFLTRLYAVVCGAIVIIAAARMLLKKNKPAAGCPQSPLRMWLFLFLWLLLGALPSFFMIAHLRYYLMLAWPSFITILLLVLRSFVGLVRFKRAVFCALVAATVLFCAYSSKVFLHTQDERGMRSNETMIRGAHFIQQTHEALMKTVSSPPLRSIFIFDGFFRQKIPVNWFLSNEDGALRIWYNNFSLQALQMKDLMLKSDGIYCRSAKYTHGVQPFKERKIYPQPPFFIVELFDGIISVKSISASDLSERLLARGQVNGVKKETNLP